MLPLWAVIVHAQDAPDQPSPLAALLREALFAEEAERDLAEAEKGYREILRRFDDERAYAATAMLRLGEVLLARGETEEAELLFTRVLREFGDQEAVAKVAETRLGDKAGRVAATTASEKMSRLQKMLEQSPDLLNVTVNGATPLERAAADGEIELVKYLLENGAEIAGGENPYRKVNDGEVVKTPLGRAVANSHLDVVELLLEKGAKMVDGVLHSAAGTGNLAIAKRLLAAGADPNVSFGSSVILKDPAAEPPAVSRRGLILPRSNRDPNAKPPNYYTPLEVAAEKGFTEMAKLLLENGVDFEKNRHFRALPAAVERKDAGLVRALLERGATTDGIVPWRWGNATVLHIAAYHGSAEVVQLLLDAGAELEAKNKDRELTPLHEATGGAVEALLAAGASPHARTKNGLTPLMRLWGDGAKEKVESLVKAGAKVNEVSEYGYSPIIAAAENATVDGARALVEAGADLKYVASFGGVIHAALARRNEEMIRYLVEAGADVDQVDDSAITPLYRSVARLDVELVSLLLELGAKPDGPGDESPPPIAALPLLDAPQSQGLRTSPNQRGNTETKARRFDEIVRLLVDAGADVNAVDKDERTALFKAAHGHQKGIVDFLLDSGASALAGKEPAFKAITNTTSEEARTLRADLFLRSQLEAEDRSDVLRLIIKGGSEPFANIRSGSEAGAEPPPCLHTLFEVYAFFTVFVSAEGPVKIWRQGAEEPMVVDLAKALDSTDPASDVPLAWGDVVEFHAASDHEEERTPISDAAREVLEKYLSRTVDFVWRDDAGEEIRRQKVTFFPNWKRAQHGRGWVPGAANAYTIVEGGREVSVLPSFDRLAWKDEKGADIHPARWVVTRKDAGTDDVRERTFSIDYSHRSEETGIPEDGDVIVLEGRGHVRNPSSRPKPASASPRTGRRAVVLPPSSR